MNYAAEVEGVLAVPAETETVQKAERLVDIAVFSTEYVNLFGPV